MAEKIEVGIKVTGTGDATKSLDQVDGATKDLSGNIDGATGALNNMTGGAIMAFKGVIGGVRTAVAGMKTFKGAMISTGIGALVVLVGSLVLWFTKTQKGAEALEIATASLGIIVTVITDKLSSLGGILAGVFTDPVQSIKDFGAAVKTYVMDQLNLMMDGIGLLGSAVKKLFARDFSGAMEDAKAGALKLGEGLLRLNPTTAVIGLLVDEVIKLAPAIEDALIKTGELTAATIKLRAAERALMVDEAEKRAIMDEQRVISGDISKSFEERIAANKIAQALEKELFTEQLRLAEERLRIQQGEMALGENLEADLLKEAELQAAAIRLRSQSAKMKKRFLMEEMLLVEQQQAELDAIQKQKDADAAKTLADDAKILAQKKKDLAEEVKAEQAAAEALKAARMGVANSALASISAVREGQRLAALSNATSEEHAEQINKKYAERKRKLAIANILLQQGQAIASAIAGATAAGMGTGVAAPLTTPIFMATMIGSVLAGFAGIKGIMNQAGAAMPEFGDVDTGGGGGGGGGGGSTQLALTPTLDSFGAGTLELPAVQAFIIQNDIADAATLQAEIQAQASL